MGMLRDITRACDAYDKFVQSEVQRARADRKVGQNFLRRWRDLQSRIPRSTTPTGVQLPRLALPEIDEPGEIARYLFGQGLPGEFPFLNSAYPQMYLEPLREIETGSYGKKTSSDGAKEKASGNGLQRLEEPTRLLSGLMLT